MHFTRTQVMQAERRIDRTMFYLVRSDRHLRFCPDTETRVLGVNRFVPAQDGSVVTATGQ